MRGQNNGRFDAGSLVSAINEAWDLKDESNDTCCANCGKAEADNVKLKDCDCCDLAQYCSDKCQQDHRETHEAICKQRVTDLLRDELLFTQPESSHLGDCPICFLPLSLDVTQFTVTECCSKLLCNGCVNGFGTATLEQRHKLRCPFCRKLPAKDEEETNTRFMKRAEADDPDALGQVGMMFHDEGDYDKASQYYSRAAELGDAVAHYNLSVMYRDGEGVEKDDKKAMYHLEEAAIAGHPSARFNLGLHEGWDKKFDRAVKHWIIAANLGHGESLDNLKEYYKRGHVSKDDFAAALRAHQAAVDATKSPQRQIAENVFGSE